ncbi:hypothetical protein FYJ75_11265 [Roseburia sp. MUC/MUC-530-WT-4D]|uniref:Uncharacterized protein n=1 Tax=Roseburia porci TaxID=2605790 RepID=A0A6L5YUG0_9FIRM|nr:hypothetical protein [Roseburia porci]MST75589.1 hypothetical protein [Roseburia porci]
MTKLLEYKDKIIRFYENYETYMYPAFKFVIALITFLLINTNIGFMTAISTFPVALILALVCCLLPQNGTIWIAAFVIIADMYALSPEVALTAAVLLAVVYFVYFRFAPKDGMGALFTPIAFKLNIPYIMPVGTGLFGELYSVISVVCGTVVYYFLDGIHRNSTTLAAVVTEDKTGSTSKFSVSVGQLLGNKEMFLVIGIFVVTSIVVYFIRRTTMDHAWLIAIVSGVLIQALGLFAGYLILGITGKTVTLIIGAILSLVIGFILQFFFMNLDYARTERVQFEDDEYYYYVKAVPKKTVAVQEKTVKHFGNTASMGKRIDHSKQELSEEEEELARKVFAKELDIDEKYLK